jgi:hypothetical protein
MSRSRKVEGQKVIMNPNSLRNLKQYKDMNEPELVDKLSNLTIGTTKDIELDTMIQREYKKYEEAYDLSEMMPNDVTTLKALILATIRLNNYEKELNIIESQGITDANILLTDKISNVCDKLRSSISALQDTLKISRKVRRSEKEQSVIAFLEDLKTKAKVFYDKKMITILCPKDNTQLGSMWLLYQESKQNKLHIYCNRCKTTHVIDLYELYSQKKTSNKPEQLPESVR